MEKVIEPIEKKKQPYKNKATLSHEKREKSTFAKLYGICKGLVSYESDDILYAYKFN